MNKSFLFFISLSLSIFANAKDAPYSIPANLLYQIPDQSIAKNELAELTGSRPLGDDLIDKTLNLKLGNIYVSYINSKATLSESSNWNRHYPLVQGHYAIRFVAQFQTGFYTGNLSFDAKLKQHYQILSERDKSVKNFQYFFWIANKDTGEVVSEKILLQSIGASTSINYIPVIR